MELSNYRTQIMRMTKGVIVAYAITAIAFLAYAMLVTYTNMSEQNESIIIAVITLLSVMVAGFDAAKGANQRGWLWGMGAGFAYIAVMVIIMTVLLPNFSVDSRTFTTIIIGIAGGGLGGMLGINLRRN